MVTRDIPHLTIHIFLDVVVEMKFLLLSLVWYLFNVVSDNRYLTRGTNRNGNQTIFGLFHDSLNLVKTIQRKLLYQRQNLATLQHKK